MDPNSQNYWQGQQNDQSLPPTQTPPVSQPSGATQPSQDQPPQQAPEQPISAYNGYDLTTPAAVGGAAVQSAVTPIDSNGTISWQASEYIHHQKGFLWFAGFGGVVVVLVGVAVWLQAWTFVALIIVMAIAFLVYALRKPRALQYILTPDDIQIGHKAYHYKDFRAFGIIPDGDIFSVQLIPVKRFMPAITIYFEEKDGERIVDALGTHLPMEQLEHDAVDRLMRRLRF